jgi:molybdenum cofactor cytidylyltransferase
MIAGLILAAGEGTRFGTQPKLLAELDGRPLLEHAITAQCAVPELERVVVVLGAHAAQLLERIDFRRGEPIVCERWSEGQSASLQFGAAHLEGAHKVIVTLGDEPRVTASMIGRMVSEPGGVRACFGGRPGHPVVLGPEQLAALASLTGDRGAQTLLSGRTIDFSALGSVRDVDTPEDLEAIRNEARAII